MAAIVFPPGSSSGIRNIYYPKYVGHTRNLTRLISAVSSLANEDRWTLIDGHRKSVTALFFTRYPYDDEKSGDSRPNGDGWITILNERDPCLLMFGHKAHICLFETRTSASTWSTRCSLLRLKPLISYQAVMVAPLLVGPCVVFTATTEKISIERCFPTGA